MISSGTWQRISRILLLLGAVLVFAWASQDAREDLPRVMKGIPFALDYIGAMYPPDWSVLPELVDPLGETLRMAIVSILSTAVIVTPLSFLAARNTMPSLPIYLIARGIINVARAIPTLLWAILFVSLVGLGPLAGIFAMTFHCVGALGKYFSEAVEAIGPSIREILEAMRIDGASEIQAIYYGLLAAVAPLFASYLIYYFEWAVRVGTILGLVGAGGIGLRLTMAIRLFKRQQVSAMVISIVAMVMVIDLCSRQIRKRLLA
jgi:phosphonate transport system permease protein